ncbi:hypothetical protein H4582DRAFT_2069315 [Lactarius indigo]|nr:hypothetical protein H4582DRAFT_2069315 [Lactarius indigo]
MAYRPPPSRGHTAAAVTNVPVSQADDLLRASFQLYRHTGTNETEAILRTIGNALPAVLHAHVRTVAPTTYFNSLCMQQQTPRKRSRGEGEVGREPTTFKNETTSPDSSNPGCDTDGFSAIAGWDPITSIGTSNFEILQEIVLGLPSTPLTEQLLSNT